MEQYILKLNDGSLINDNTLTNDVFKRGFWHYTSENGANGILNEKMFRINNLSKMNDKNEEKLYGENKDCIFVLSFVNSDTEKIPMWYLYSGITGKGISLKVTAGNMLTWLKQISYVFDYDTKEKYNIGKGLKMYCGWTFYRDLISKRIMYKSKYYDIDDLNDVDTTYFLKDYPWNYEKEFRIVFVNETNKRIKRIGLPIPDDCYKRIEIKTAPEYDKNHIESMMNKDGFKKLAQSKVIESNLGIDMDLIKNNYDDFVDFIRNQCLSKNRIEEFDNLKRFLDDLIKE